MVDHGARDHATWSASSTARNVHCAGALALVPLAPHQKETIHSARGTAGHQVSEKCLRTGKDAMDFLDTIEKTKEQSITIDEELVYSAQEYVDYCRGRLKAYRDETGEDAVFWIEERFSLAELAPPFDAGGTGDFIMYFPRWGLIEIVDFKNGMGVVDATENPQLRTYALGAMLHHKGLDITHVKVTIVQPRAPHKEGRIRSETFHVADLVEWTADLMTAMWRTKDAIDERHMAGQNKVLLDEWAEKWLNPGKCKWCPAEGFCPKKRAQAIDRQNGIARVWFDQHDQPTIANTPDEMSPEAIAETLDLLPMLEDWISAVRGLARTLADAGTEIPGYFLADKIGNRKWAAEDDKVVSDLKKIVGLTDDQIFEKPSLKSVAQLEKVLGSKRKKEIENFWHKPVTGKNLVSAAETTRPPAPNRAEQYFVETEN